jgi:hypothetical protein
MTEPFKTVRDNLTELGLLKPRYLIGPLLAALVYLGLYLTTGYAMDTLPAIGLTAALNAVLAFSVSVGLPPKDSLRAAISEFIGMFVMSVILLIAIPIAHGQEPGNLFGIAVVFFGFVFAISTGVGWGLAQPNMALTFISDNW